MFIDELTIKAKAGKGGDGVVRWRHEKSVAWGGPAGGNGGRGGSVYMRAVRDISLLGKYTGFKEFAAHNGADGAKKSQHGRDGEDCCIDVPIGAIVKDLTRDRVYQFLEEGEVHRILRGGSGGLGNEHFKSATNRSPEETTKGKRGESGEFYIELALVVDVGLIGLPNAGKSTLINTLTNAKSKIGAYPFTTTEPHLGELYGFILADIPGLIEGASQGKGLGDKFLRHVSRTNMLIHCISLENEDPLQEYKIIRSELQKYDPALLQKEEWIVLTKLDLAQPLETARIESAFREQNSKNIFFISAEKGIGVKELGDALVRRLRAI